MDPDLPSRYDVRLTERAEAEIEAIMMRLTSHSPEGAEQWRLGLLQAVRSLELFPNRCPIADEAGLYGRPVRVMLYPRGRTAYHILFEVLASVGDEPPTVRVLRVVHGAQER